jgi:septal ring factor EnvC (AmiA/AmiB activator)
MKEFFLKYFREILLVVLVTTVIFLLVKIFTPTPDKSELLKYKIEQLDKKIQETEKKQLELDKNIQQYKEDIKIIDEVINDIRSQKTIINNYYENKEKEIPSYTNKQIDSVLRKRYKY